MKTTISQPHKHHDHHANLFKSLDRKTISIETYLNFLYTRHIHNLNVDNLNKIISIHGLKKGRYRKDAEEILSTITNPIHPSRSTLKDEIPSIKSTITLAETIKDLKLLNWQECSITSIKTISSKNSSSPTDIPIGDPYDIPVTEVAANLMFLKGKKRERCPIPLATDTTDASSLMSIDSAPRKNNSSVSGFDSCEASSKVMKIKPESNGGEMSKSENGYGYGGFVLPAMVPKIGVRKRKPGIKRVYLKNLLNSDDAEAVAANSTFSDIQTMIVYTEK